MDKNNINSMISEVFNEISEGIKSGSFGKKVKIALTTFGSEHGSLEMLRAAEIAKSKYSNFDIVLIGEKFDTDIENIVVKDDKEGHKVMDELLKSGKIQGAVTQHYDFPIGVSTVGKVVTPATGKEMIIATTTGTTSTNRVSGMILNAIGGISVAKSLGIKNPKVGILNVDGARQTEKALKELQQNGYNIEFTESKRADGGCVMRGNDLLMGTPDVMVCDSLTGNILIKMFSSFSTGGNYETVGAGYGPSVGEGYDKVINIVSRASGAPLIAEALKYCADCCKNNLADIAEDEFASANFNGLKEILAGLTKEKTKVEEEVAKPEKKVVTYDIAGIDILELDDACKLLWKSGVYAESGMGCTGPVILVNEEEGEKAEKLLQVSGII